MSNYRTKERKRSHWLLADGTIIREPIVEETPAGRRVRILGSSESVSNHDLGMELSKWAHSKARRTNTAPVYNLGGDPNNPEELDHVINKQVGTYSFAERFPPLATNAEYGDAGWLFRHPTLPIFARIRLRVRVMRGTPYVETAIAFAPMCQRDPRGFAYYGGRSVDWTGEPLHSAPDHLVEDATAILESNGIPVGTQNFTNNEAAMMEAIRRFRLCDGLSELRLPDLLQAKQPQAGESAGVISEHRLEFDSACQNANFLREMVDYVEALEPAERLVELRGEMVSLLRGRGVSLPEQSIRSAAAILHGGKATPTQLKPYRHVGDTLDEDREHRVMLNLYDGIVHVTCNHRSTPKANDVLAYEIAQERASITGESDLFEAFLSTLTDYRKAEEIRGIIQAARHT